MEFTYCMPTKVYFGRDCVMKNKELLAGIGKKALIVTGRNSAKKNGSYRDMVNALEEVGIEHVLFDEVEENPSLETIEKGSQVGRSADVDFVIGIGGGSPMDAAKAMALFVKNPNITKDNLFSMGILGHVPVVTVATTSGTGSEVTQYSIVTSNKEKTKKNLGQTIFPVVSFLDSQYTFDLPYDITVNTAIDAFTHLVEGYLNANATYMSDIYGEKGFELFKSCFEKLINNNLDEEFRDDVMLASSLAGMQIAQNGTAIPHGMGYSLTYFKGVPHGIANGILTIEYLKVFKNQDKINRMLGILGLDTLEELEGIFDKLVKLEIDITKEEILEYSTAFISNKAKLKNHPEEITLEEIVRIYTKSLMV